MPLGGFGTEGAPGTLGTAGTDGTVGTAGAPGAGGTDGGAAASAVAPHDGHAVADGSTSAPHLGHLIGPLSTVGGLKHITCSFRFSVFLMAIRLSSETFVIFSSSRHGGDGSGGAVLRVSSFRYVNCFSCGSFCQQLLVLNKGVSYNLILKG